ncbi:putative protein kinase RLK-Pelle-CR4L family [Helianthus debilis subsp. tardiflorus]
MEVEVLFEYKHENIIGLVGYCDENGEKILVYEYASNGSLDRHLRDASITWTKQLKIGIGIATGLDFLHEGGYPMIHKDVKSANILLDDNWKAKITNFGLSVINFRSKIKLPVDNAAHLGIATRCTLNGMMCGRLAFIKYFGAGPRSFVSLVKQYYKEGKHDELVFEGIKDKIVPKSLTTVHTIAYQCLHRKREKRPAASEVVLQLKKALEFQEDIEIWEARLPRDYKEIIHKSRTPELYSNVRKKDLYVMFSKGILLQDAKVCAYIGSNGERSEMISATTFSYENNGSHKRRSIQKSRYVCFDCADTCVISRGSRLAKLNLICKIKTKCFEVFIWDGNSWCE